MIVPHFSCVMEIKADAVINPSLSVRGSSPFFYFFTGFSAAIRCEEVTNLKDKDNTVPFLSYSLSCSLFIIISGPGLLSRTSSPAWSPDSDLSTASGLLSFLPVPPPPALFILWALLTFGPLLVYSHHWSVSRRAIKPEPCWVNVACRTGKGLHSAVLTLLSDSRREKLLKINTGFLFLFYAVMECNISQLQRLENWQKVCNFTTGTIIVRSTQCEFDTSQYFLPSLQQLGRIWCPSVIVKHSMKSWAIWADTLIDFGIIK